LKSRSSFRLQGGCVKSAALASAALLAGSAFWGAALVASSAAAETSTTSQAALDAGQITIDAGKAAHPLPSTFFGLMVEDINHSMHGGLYAQLVQNGSMMASDAEPLRWSALGECEISLDAKNPLNAALSRSLRVEFRGESKDQPQGVSNSGYWGIPVIPSQTYTASFFAKASRRLSGPLTLTIQSVDGKTVYARGQVQGLDTAWRQLSVKLRTAADAPVTASARFVLSANELSGTTLWLDSVSLFPQTYRNTKLRPDLMVMLQGLQLNLVRFPGGGYLTGGTVANRFNWKNTIGPVWARTGHRGDFDYFSENGMGLLEYLEMTEASGAKSLLTVYAGKSGSNLVPADQLQPYIQDAVDEIEYVSGSTTTRWGSQRAADGHPNPFPLEYVMIGNEEGFRNTDKSYNEDRFPRFYDAIHAAYPSLKIIATGDNHTDLPPDAPKPVTTRTPDAVDEHFYLSAAELEKNSAFFDSVSRNGPKYVVEEWAAVPDTGPVTAAAGPPSSDLRRALAGAAFLTGLVRNSDLVVSQAYAPAFVNVNNPRWNTNLIGFNALTTYGSPAYYVEKMLAENHGDEVLNTSYAGTGALKTVATRDGKIGTIYLMIVNSSSLAQPTRIDIQGVSQLSATGKATILTSASNLDTDSIDDPTNVMPVTHPIKELSKSFTYAVPPYSATILTLAAR
jgi:alpha-L-arabinofuranosidase